ncbi:MAG: extracellular solute-binding protein, partial [Rhodospirillaceae bacterium]|nr:extracellular solute-binding protein [Rhodospirillaceae bacterium]
MTKHVLAMVGIGAAVLLSGTALAQERIVIAGRDGVYAEGLRRVVEAYMAANPGTEVELLELPYANLYERAVISMREGSGAYDVVLMDDTWAPEFMGNGWLADLDALGGGADADFIGPTVAVSRYPYGDGTLYALPMVGNVELFAYRSDLFEEYGLDQPPADWDAVVDAARTLSEAGAVDFGVVYRGQKANPIVTGFLPILWAYGARLVDEEGQAALDTPEAVAALETYLSLRAYAPEDVVVYNASEVRDALQSGRAAMSIEVWPSWIPAMDDPAV